MKQNDTLKMIILLLVIFVQSNLVFSDVSIIAKLDRMARHLSEHFSTWSNLSVEECQCKIFFDSMFLSFNYFENNRTCQIIHNTDVSQQYSFIVDITSAYYFIPYDDSEEMSFTVDQEFIWTFDGTYKDTASNFSVKDKGKPSFSSQTIHGSGKSLKFSGKKGVAVVMKNPHLKLFNLSWTFELWIQFEGKNNHDYGMIEQCHQRSPDYCLHLTVRGQKLFFGFHNNDLSGNETLKEATWYHVAFVFDCPNRTRSIYLRGLLDNRDTTNDCYQGRKGALKFGTVDYKSRQNPFHGQIDQINYVNRAKTPQEILHDATLTFYFSFDNESIEDEGPLRIQAISSGQLHFTTGAKDRAIVIANGSNLSIVMSELLQLGTSEYEYSLTVWIRPNRLENVTIIQVIDSIRNGKKMCIPVISLTDEGRLNMFPLDNNVSPSNNTSIPINQWTHVAISSTNHNKLDLYINGSFIATYQFQQLLRGKKPFSLIVGMKPSGSHCAEVIPAEKQYEGAIDELRLYSRHLTIDEIKKLTFKE